MQLTVIHHINVLLLRGTCQAISPVKLDALAPMQIDQLFGAHLHHAGDIQLHHLLQCQEDDIICSVDSLRYTVNMMSDRNTSSKIRIILHIVDPVSS